jgi:hypothetical protein
MEEQMSIQNLVRVGPVSVILLIIGATVNGRSQGLLEPPSLIAPPDSADTVRSTAVLSWHSILTASGYHLQVSVWSDFYYCFIDTTLTDTTAQLWNLYPLQHYWWRIATRNALGDGWWSPSRIFVTVEWLGIHNDLSKVLPREFFLLQNYPNPFNPSTTINYELPISSVVKLSVYDMLGREVSVLVNERKNAGSYEVKFDAAGFSSGVYFYRIQAGDFTQTNRLLLVK